MHKKEYWKGLERIKNVRRKKRIDTEKAKMHHMVSIHYLLFTGNDQLYY